MNNAIFCSAATTTVDQDFIHVSVVNGNSSRVIVSWQPIRINGTVLQLRYTENTENTENTDTSLLIETIPCPNSSKEGQCEFPAKQFSGKTVKIFIHNINTVIHDEIIISGDDEGDDEVSWMVSILMRFCPASQKKVKQMNTILL